MSTRRNASWFVIFALAFLGCAERGSPPFALEFDPGASAEERETVLRAAGEWNARVGQELFYVPDERGYGGCDRVLVRFVDEMPAKYDEYSGLYERVGCHRQVLILHDFARDLANATHELGHALDLDHSGDKESVMFWSTRSASRITDQDVLRVRMRWLL